jgi:PIN domain nuclease of toxin-antitoxin system
LNLLLDTHALLWMMFADARLGQAQARLIADEANAIYISSISIFEIANKVRIGKLPMTLAGASALDSVCDQFAFLPLHLSIHHAQRAGLLAGPHRDPFDRMLAAQSIIEKIPIVTVDAKLRELGADVVW